MSGAVRKRGVKSFDDTDAPFPVLKIDPDVLSPVGPLEEHLPVVPTFRIPSERKREAM